MKTFLPIVSHNLNPWQTMRLSLECLDDKRLGKQRVESYQIWNVITGVTKTKSWRSSPAIHMWRGYPQALGVYISINCALWAQRTSKTTGKPFTNLKMGEHILRCAFGKNDAGVDVAAQAMAIAQQAQQQALKAEGKEQEAAAAGTTGVVPLAQPEIAAATAAAFAPTAAEAAAAAASVEPLAASSSSDAAAPAAAAASASPAPLRSGLYVDNIRIPWWFHNPRIHDSDAAILYRKDPKHYAAFAPQAKQYEEYVWPRDIDPRHPEQAEEIDALAAIIAAEEAAKPEKKKRKRKEEKKEEEENSDEEAQSASADEGEGEESKNGAEAASHTGEQADASTPVKETRSRRASASQRRSPSSVADLSPSAASAASSAPTTPPSPALSTRSRLATKGKDQGKGALSDATGHVLNAQQQARGAEEKGSAHKRRKTAAADATSEADSKQPNARRKIRLQ